MATDEHVVYLNGQFVPRLQAVLDIEDRGSLFADGVYEVVRYYAGHPFAVTQHIARLRASLAAIKIPPPEQIEHLGAISGQLMTQNELSDADVYWQITRGGGFRDPLFSEQATPTVFSIAYPRSPIDPNAPAPGITAILTEDLRWHRCDIKSLMLLPNVLAKNQAVSAGADEAIFHRDNQITEGSATSVFIVHHGKLYTHPADHWILDGITRHTVLDLAHRAGIGAFERPFTTDRLLSADEVMICGTTTPVTGVITVDGKAIGIGSVGPITKRIHGLYLEHVLRFCAP